MVCLRLGSVFACARQSLPQPKICRRGCEVSVPGVDARVHTKWGLVLCLLELF